MPIHHGCKSQALAMNSESQITMNDPEAWLLLLAVGLVMLLPRLVNRVLLGFEAFLSPADVKRRLDEDDAVVLVDVRTAGEFRGALGHIKGAKSIPLHEIGRRLADRDDDLYVHSKDSLILVCRTDNRAVRAARLLKKADFQDVKVMSGGMRNWNGEQFPVER